MSDEDEELATVPCEECGGVGEGHYPNGMPIECEACGGEGSVCAACGGSRCLWEGECVGEDERRREEEQARKYEEHQRVRHETIRARVGALDVAIAALPSEADVLRGLRADLIEMLPAVSRGSSRGSAPPDAAPISQTPGIIERANGLEPSTFSLGSKLPGFSEAESAENAGDLMGDGVGQGDGK